MENFNKIKEGARTAVQDCAKVQAGESVVIITDNETRDIALVIASKIEELTKNIQFFVMEDFGERPLNLPAEIKEALVNNQTDVSFYIASSGVSGEFLTFRKPMLEIISNNKKLRHAHLVGITPEIMADGMCSDYREIQRISRLVFAKVKNASKIRVTTELGTDLTAEFSPKLRWVVADGNITPENFSNLPDGEVFTCPLNINGKVIIDGCLGDYFFDKFGSIEETPITVEIVNGRAKRESLACANQALLEELTKYIFETDVNSNRVGEFAIGTNIYLKKLIGNLLQDEKFPGVHIAFGSPLPYDTNADWDSDVHLDGVIKNTTIYVDGEKIMDNGEFINLG